VTPRHDEAGGAENGGRAQDGADVVRIRHLIEHDQRTAAMGVRDEVVQLGFGQRLGFEQDALVHGVGSEQTVEIARGDALGRDRTGAERGGEPARGVLRREEPQRHARGVVQRCLYGVHAVEADNAIAPAR
jgi:hypothetical protein